MSRFKHMLIIFCICFFSFSINAKPLTLLWWNVQNLFDSTNDPDKDDLVLTKAQYAEKISLICQKLKEIKPDIVGLAEVENKEILKEIAAKSGFKNFYLEPGNDPRGINLCLLTNLPTTYVSHKDQPTPYKEDKKYKFSRDCPEANFTYNNKNIYLLLNHLKAENKEDHLAAKKRAAQVKGILDIIADIYKKNQQSPYILIMGDLNSERYNESLNILQKSGLKILNYFFKEDQVYTTNYHDQKKDIDYFIVNFQLYKNAKIKRLVSFHNKSFEKISDHYPLLLELDL